MHPVLVETHRSPVVASLDGGDRPPAPLHAAPKRQFLKRTLGRLILWGGMTVLVMAGWLFNKILCQPLAVEIGSTKGRWVVLSALRPEVQELFHQESLQQAFRLRRLHNFPHQMPNWVDDILAGLNLALTLDEQTLTQLTLNHSCVTSTLDPYSLTLEDVCGIPQTEASAQGAWLIVHEARRLRDKGTIAEARYKALKQVAIDRID